MAYVVTEKCIKCKYMDCVTVCPVNCFHEGENMLVINPEHCIDCGVCELECPIGAIEKDYKAIKFLEHNRMYSELWPNITIKGDEPYDAKDFEEVPNKLEKYFSPNPGQL